MTLIAERDVATLRAGLERWLGRRVGEITRPAPGWSCETVVVDGKLVIRLPPVGEGIFPAYDLEQQAAVQAAAGAAGVPVASPVTYEPDPSFLGAPFVAMPFVEGPIPCEFTPADPWLLSLATDRARRAVWDVFVDTIVRIHRAPAEDLGLRCGLGAELDFWGHYVDWATGGAPPQALADAFAWCRANRPSSEPPGGLLWGDVRLGNVVFDPTTLAAKAVLDWDMASKGPIEMDLAWFVALERVQTDLSGMAVHGFATHEEAVDIVEQRVGRRLLDLDWYEVFALVRASAVSARIAILFRRSGRQSMFEVGEVPTLAAASALIAAL